MDLLIDPREVEKSAQKKWDENYRFRRWLKDQKNPELDLIVEAVGRRVSQKIDCTQCANCCRALTIVPSSKDIKRLADALHIEPFAFKTKYLKRDHEGDLVIKQRPCPFLKGSSCSVYLSRPETCRSYPHLDKSHMAGRGWYILENTLICPIVYNTYEVLKKELKFPGEGIKEPRSPDHSF